MARRQSFRLPETTARTGKITFRIKGPATDVAVVRLDNLDVASRPVTLTGSTIEIVGGNQADTAFISTQGRSILVNMNNDMFSFPVSKVSLITFKGRGGNDTMKNKTSIRVEAKGGSGDDILRGGRAADRLEGEDGNDRLMGAGGNDGLLSGDGDDQLRGGKGVDTLVGGSGIDRYWQDRRDAIQQDSVRLDSVTRNNSIEVVRLSKSDGVTSVTASSSKGGRISVQELTDEFRVIYTPSASYSGDDSITVETIDDDQQSESQAFTIRVEPFVLDNGTLIISGGDGDDTVLVRQIDQQILVQMNGLQTKVGVANIRAIQFYGNAGNDQFANETSVPVTAYGGAGNDTLSGGSGNDAIFGEAGDDILFGGAGDDWIAGGDGRDQINGQRGNDRVFGDDGLDWLYGGLGHDELDGGDGDDELYGDAGRDTLNGNSGNDLLDGGLDDDVLDGQTDAWWLKRNKRFCGWIRQ